jgi:DNA helicase IV
VVLTVPQAKGLEFDAVVAVDPDGIVAASPRGSSESGRPGRVEE